MSWSGISGQDGPSKTEKQRQRNIMKSTWHDNPDTNPCLEEHKHALKCLDENDYDHEKCQFHFANYKSCKKFWAYVVQERRSRGQYPYMPPAAEREKVRQQMMGEMVDEYNKKKAQGK